VPQAKTALIVQALLIRLSGKEWLCTGDSRCFATEATYIHVS